MQPHDAMKALRSVGVNADASGPRRLRADGIEMVIFSPRHAPTRADAERAIDMLEHGQRALLLADTLTPSLSQAALDDDRLVVAAKKTVIWERQLMQIDEDQSPKQKKTVGRRPYGRFAVARALLAADGPLTQQQLVDDAGVAQGGISRAFTSPLFNDVLDRTWGKTHVTDRRALFDRVVTGYPGPGGVATYWWHETSTTSQAESVAASDETALVSGDVAADRISGWRTPEHAVIYTRAEPDLRRLGFALADPEDYTLMLVHAEDHTIWSTATAWNTPRTADPLVVAYDVARTGTLGDQGEAVDRIRDYVIGRGR